MDYKCISTWSMLNSLFVKESVQARLLGSIGVYVLCKNKDNSYEYPYALKDIDIIIGKKDANKAFSLTTNCGGILSPQIGMASGGTRARFRIREQCVDFFIDPFTMCRRIKFYKRFSLYQETLSPPDLLLSIMQNINLTHKDIFNIYQILQMYPVNAEQYRYKEVLGLACGRDWGLYTIISDNCNDILTSNFYEYPEYEIYLEEIIKIIQECRKTFHWKLRSVMGKKMPWYINVDNNNY